MSELYDRIVAQRGSLERLVARIPGFKGYHEKQGRRHADRLLRDHIADEIQKRIDRLVRIENSLLDKIGMGALTSTRDAKNKVQIYHDTVKTAAPKYDGWFAYVKIDTEDYDRIYSFDEAQIRYLDQFDEALAGLEQAVTAPDTLTSAADKLYAVAQEALDAFSLRDDLITGFEGQTE